MVLRETVKEQIDTLNEYQLSKIADYILSLKVQAKSVARATPFWQKATAKERADNFLEWAAGLKQTGLTLSDEAFDRGDIYEL